MIFALDLYSFYFVDIVSLSHNVPLAVVLSLLYLALNIIVLYLTIKATRDDPTDPTIYAERKAKAQGYNLALTFSRKYFDNRQFKFYCEVCESHVHDHAKHCG